MKINGASIVVETLISHGVKDVFGFPGGAVLDLFDELYKHSDSLTHHLFCHEQGATHAADGYARASGKTGVVVATSGPGATNLVTGIATAYLDSTPLIAITGNVALPLIGKDSFQEVDITGITMPITKHNYIVKDISELEDTLCEAFQIANSGRPGPVLIDIPKNIQSQEYEFRGGHPWDLTPNALPSEDALQAAAKLINNSERPIIYAGGGVIIAEAELALAEFAEIIDAPVGFSMMGLSAMDYKNPRKLGMTGMHGLYSASRMSAEADLIIGIGVRFSDRATGDKDKFRENANVIHIDIDRAEINKNIETSVSVVGDIAQILPKLTELIDEQKRPEWNKLIKEYKAEWETIGATSKDSFSPRNIIKLVREYTGDECIVGTDVGQHQMWVAQYYDFSRPRTFLTSGGLGTMGFGLGAVLGASIAKGGKRTVLFTGDGSFHMNMNEVATAVMHGLPIVIIVLNNRVLGMVRQWQALFYDDRFSNTTLDRATDYVKLADAFAARGYHVESLTELQSALDTAFASADPVIIDCLIDRDEKVLPMIPPGASIQSMIVE